MVIKIRCLFFVVVVENRIFPSNLVSIWGIIGIEYVCVCVYVWRDETIYCIKPNLDRKGMQKCEVEWKMCW